MDLTHFVMGFALVDVCFARKGDDCHAHSFDNAFCAKASPWPAKQKIINKIGATSGFETCFGPSTLDAGAGAKTLLASCIKKFETIVYSVRTSI